MEVSLNRITHNLVALIKYAVILVGIVAAAKYLPPMWQSRCYIDTENSGMREALGKTTMKVDYDPDAVDEKDLKRGDIVVVSMESSEIGKGRQKYPFRLVAVAGDWLEANRGFHQVNGKEENYDGLKPVNDNYAKIDRKQIPRGHVYVLPDDRPGAKSGHPQLIPLWRVVGKMRKR